MASIIDKYTKEELEAIVKNSVCLRDVVKKVGYSCDSGNNNDTVKRRIEMFGISTNHFIFQKPKERTEENVFCKNSTATQATLRRWFIKISDSSRCAICGQGIVWNSKRLTMILDHINGDKHDNEKSNLRWICPNCDSQLPTYAGRNIKNL